MKLKKRGGGGKLRGIDNPINKGWFWCCGNKIQKINDMTTIIGELYCRKCKTSHNVIIIGGKLKEREEKNAD
jgi:hypothetical protein